MLTANIRNLQMCKVLLNRPPVDPTKAKFGFFPFVSESQHPRHDWGGGGSEAPSRDGRPHLRGEEAPLGRGAGRCGERNQVGTGSNLVQEFRLCYLSCSMMGGIPQRLWSLKGTHPSKWWLIKPTLAHWSRTMARTLCSNKTLPNIENSFAGHYKAS